MAACSIPTVLADAGCYTNVALTTHQQKVFIAYMYFTWAEVVGATAIEGGATGLMEFAKCWQVLTDDQVQGVEIQSILNGVAATTEIDITVSELQELTKCISGLSDRELDRIIAALKCALFPSLT